MLVLTLLLLCSAVQSTGLSSKVCSNIRLQYKAMRLGKESHVPDKPKNGRFIGFQHQSIIPRPQ